ncbi:MAG: hypothetical protein F6K41_08925 [Symploca sp. SIO3E6]|nr:hypothetical protein [Caldora sp. SIO3E6]
MKTTNLVAPGCFAQRSKGLERMCSLFSGFCPITSKIDDSHWFWQYSIYLERYRFCEDWVNLKAGGRRQEAGGRKTKYLGYFLKVKNKFNQEDYYKFSQ